MIFSGNNQTSQQGFTLFLAVIITSIVILLGMTIAGIMQREALITASSRASTQAFYAADTALECALKWDDRNVPEFANGASTISCAGDDLISVNSCSGDCDYSFILDDRFYANVCAEVRVDKTASSESGVDWYDPDWVYRDKITIQASQVDGNLTDFPVYVDMSDLSNNFHSNVKNESGDIRITTADGITEIPREVVYYDGGSNQGELYFRAPNLPASSDIEFFIYYGNVGAFDYATNAIYGAENVWTNGQQALWHLEENPNSTAPQMLDSTSNGRDGTSNGSMTSGDSVTGKLGQSLDFDGTDDYVEIPTNFGIFSGSDPYTMSAWVNFETLALGDVEQNIITPHGEHTVELRQEDTTSAVEFGWSDSTNFNTIRTGDLSVGVWHHVTVTWDPSGNVSIYLDGVFQDSAPTTNPTARSNPSMIGAKDIDENFNGGKIDEVRIYDRVLSVDEISAEYANQSAPSAFYTTESANDPVQTNIEARGRNTCKPSSRQAERALRSSY